MADREHYYAAIMAGGGGTRLWPLSRHNRPKQLLELVEKRTLYRMAVERIEPLIPAENILVLTIAELVPGLQQETPALPAENYYIEPAPRGNAAAIGLAALKLHQRDEDAIMACLTADHVIRNHDRFLGLLAAAYKASHQGGLVTLGIEPEGPDPTYGYIHLGAPAGVFAGMQAFRVAEFVEKPSLDLAQKYLASGEYAWNSGMFVWRVAAVLDEIKRQMPQLAAALGEIEPALGTEAERQVVERVWPGLDKISIDYGVMEGARSVLVIPARDLGWYDVGDWSRLLQLLEGDEQGNVVQSGNVLLRESNGSLILSAADLDSEKLIVLIGLDNVILIDTGDVLLVCDRSHAADVKAVVDELAKRGMDRYL
jgi:mannose-1-phosphate guanylyltransferase